MSEALARTNIYTEEDYYNLPENVRAELIDGQIYYMAAPSRIHQEILMFLSNTIFNYLNSKKGPCKVYPAPFAVKLFSEDDRNVVEPDISVICDPNKLTDRGCTGLDCGDCFSQQFQPGLCTQAEPLHGCRSEGVLDCGPP